MRHPLRFVLAGSLLLAGAPGSSARGDAAMRVLFIGNSYTRFNALPRQVARIASSVPGGPALRVRHETRGGFGLRGHWRSRQLRARLRRGRWDAVVLQPHSLGVFDHPDRLTDYARRFSAQVRRRGGRVVLFETWARRAQHPVYRRLSVNSPAEMQAVIDLAYRALARQVEAEVAPVGAAWLRATSTHPEVSWHRADGTHPAVAGSYLSACVLYGTLTGRAPTLARWQPWPMTDAQGAIIRRLAAESLHGEARPARTGR